VGEEIPTRAQILAARSRAEMKNLGSFKDPRTGKTITSYGNPADASEQPYLARFFSSSNIGRSTPGAASSRCSRAKIAKLGARAAAASTRRAACGLRNMPATRSACSDPKAGKVQEWVLPTAWSQPYDVITDRNGEAWTGSMLSDRVRGSTQERGVSSSILLARRTNIRRVFRRQLHHPGKLLGRHTTTAPRS